MPMISEPLDMKTTISKWLEATLYAYYLYANYLY